MLSCCFLNWTMTVLLQKWRSLETVEDISPPTKATLFFILRVLWLNSISQIEVPTFFQVYKNISLWKMSLRCHLGKEYFHPKPRVLITENNQITDKDKTLRFLYRTGDEQRWEDPQRTARSKYRWSRCLVWIPVIMDLLLGVSVFPAWRVTERTLVLCSWDGVQGWGEAGTGCWNAGRLGEKNWIEVTRFVSLLEVRQDFYKSWFSREDK